MGWVVKARLLPLYPRERHVTHCVGDWVGPRADLEGCEKSFPHRDSNPGPSINIPVVGRYLFILCCIMSRLKTTDDRFLIFYFKYFTYFLLRF